MKKLPFFMLLLFAFSGLGFLAPNAAIPVDDNASCGNTLLSGCVGACGPAFKVTATAPTTGLYCYEATSSLCPTNGALAIVKVNNTGIFLGDVSPGISFSFFANAGDKITIGAELFDKKTNIVCVWLGEVNITVKEP